MRNWKQRKGVDKKIFVAGAGGGGGGHRELYFLATVKT